MILKDFHTHTTYCDGNHSPEEMLLSAIEKGLTTYGFSGHGYTDFDLRYCMNLEETVQYKRDILALKEKYKDKIEVKLGIEQDVFSNHPTDDYDYVIGSVHYIRKDGVYRSIDEDPQDFENICNEWFDGDYYSFAEDYYRNVVKLAEKKIDIIGHIDLITKFNEGNRLFDMAHPRYLAAAKKAIDALLPLGVPFEINTGAISRGYRSAPYPAPELLEYIKSKGGMLILSSDTHARENICFQFDKWEKLL
ncbi:MAG: histidinol-phosphatase [Clostridia bacterium]|nr:histidinol-phosphatase [Clostridia bacterium]